MHLLVCIGLDNGLCVYHYYYYYCYCSTSYRTLYIVTKSYQTLTIFFACNGRNYKMLVIY